MNIRMIDTEPMLDALVQELESAGELAFDVEADGLFRYRANLCMVQVATRDVLAVIDTIAIKNHAKLAPLFERQQPLKVVHDASFDARMLRDVGLPLVRMFDTSIAARFLGEQQAGLATLLEKRMGVVVTKEYQKADWGRRPITPEQLNYLANDVRYLLGLADILREELRAKSIEQEVEEECAYLLRRAASEQVEIRPAWTRVKGAVDLAGPSKAVLRELCIAREEEAEARDVPSFKVITNESLLTIARKRPKTMQDLTRDVGPNALRVHQFATRIMRAIRDGEARGGVPPEDLAPSGGPIPTPEERAAAKIRDRSLSAWRRAMATERGVDPQAVLPGHCFHEIVALNPSAPEELSAIDGVGTFRIERDGAAIIAALHAPPPPILPAQDPAQP